VLTIKKVRHSKKNPPKAGLQARHRWLNLSLGFGANGEQVQPKSEPLAIRPNFNSATVRQKSVEKSAKLTLPSELKSQPRQFQFSQSHLLSHSSAKIRKSTMSTEQSRLMSPTGHGLSMSPQRLIKADLPQAPPN